MNDYVDVILAGAFVVITLINMYVIYRVRRALKVLKSAYSGDQKALDKFRKFKV